MKNYLETCPLGRTDTQIAFSIDDGREPSPTSPCICGGTPAENNAHHLAGLLTFINASAALVESIDKDGEPVEYKAFTASGERHSSEIIQVG